VQVCVGNATATVTIDVYDVALQVHQRAAGVAGVDWGVGLQAVVDDGGPVVGLHLDGAVDGADDAGGDGAGEALR
jgi:hypothetical protein